MPTPVLQTVLPSARPVQSRLLMQSAAAAPVPPEPDRTAPFGELLHEIPKLATMAPNTQTSRIVHKYHSSSSPRSLLFNASGSSEQPADAPRSHVEATFRLK